MNINHKRAKIIKEQMANRRDVRCPCGLLMFLQPDIPALHCSACKIIIKLRRPPAAVPGYNNNNPFNNAYNNNKNDNPRYGTDSPPQNYQPQPPRQPPQPPRQPPPSQQRQPRPLLRQQTAPPRQLADPSSTFGRKRAVLCGVNYRGKSYSLKGSINDAKSMRSFLIQQMGFPVDSILMLTEDEPRPQRMPTKENIRRAMRWLVQGCQAGDSLVFHFSGHGSQQKDYNGDEPDGQDEALCPLDHETEGKIIDDEINRTIVWPLPSGAKLHAVIDACYSGTVLDLPFVCKMDREGDYFWEDHTPRNAYKGTRGGMAICLSACEDHQTSGDTSAFTGKNTGAMTYSFIKAARSEPSLSYGRLLNLMRLAIRQAKSSIGINAPFTEPDMSQEPQLSSSEQFEVYSKKFFL